MMPVSLIAAFALTAGPAPSGDIGPLVRALWLVQRYGTAEAVDPAADQRVKGVLFKALGKEGELTLAELRGLMDADTFKKLAGSDDRIDAAELRSAAAAAMPESRTRLLPKILRICGVPDHLLRHDRRTAPACRPQAGGMDRPKLSARPEAACHRCLHRQFPPEHARGDDGQYRRRLLRDAGVVLS